MIFLNFLCKILCILCCDILDISNMLWYIWYIWCIDVYHSISQKYFFFMTCHNILWNVAHQCPTDSDISRLMFFLHHCVTASPGRSSEQPLLKRSSSQHCCPCLLWPGPLLAPLWSQRTAASRCGSGCRIAVADASFRYLTTVQVHLYFADTSCENPRYYALMAFLAWFAWGRTQEEMTSDRWLVEEMIRRD